MKKPLISIVGPTAVGKTKLSIELAKMFNGEIISGDSMQVYKGMDIGTAKIKQSEMEGIPHYLIDILDPCDDFTSADFKNKAEVLIQEIHSRGKLPIIVGGSGLYIQSVLYGYDFSKQPRNQAVTERLQAELAEKGAEHLYERLQKADPIQAEKVHPNNHRRLIRALEVYETTGKPISEADAYSTPAESAYHSMVIGLEMERELLYQRINARVDQMIADGLTEEVSRLVADGYKDCQSMRAIGYKEIVPWLEGSMRLEEAVELLKRNSRRFAKRQYTWFRNKMETNWYSIDPKQSEETFTVISHDLEGFLKGMENGYIQRERGGNKDGTIN